MIITIIFHSIEESVSALPLASKEIRYDINDIEHIIIPNEGHI